MNITDLKFSVENLCSDGISNFKYLQTKKDDEEKQLKHF